MTPMSPDPSTKFRGDSSDSRSPQIGLIDEREILGKVIFLLIPGSDREHAFEIGRIGVVN